MRRNGLNLNSWGPLSSPEWTLAPSPYLEQVLGQCGLWCEMTHVARKLSRALTISEIISAEH